MDLTDMKPDRSSGEDVYFLLGVYTEAALYGWYTVLFLTALVIWIKRRTKTGSSSFSFFYLVTNLLMWIIASAHLGVCFSQLYRTYDLGGTGLDYLPTSARLVDITRTDMVANMCLVTSMFWLADALLIYRTYSAWGRNFWAILLPLILHVGHIVVSIVSLYFFTHPSRAHGRMANLWHVSMFPLLFVKNIITMGILSYKIWLQRKESSENWAEHTGGTGGLSVAFRILIETAIFYTIGLLVLAILSMIRNPAKLVVLLILVPTIGIVFVMFSARVYIAGLAHKDSEDTFGFSVSDIMDGEGEAALAQEQNGMSNGDGGHHVGTGVAGTSESVTRRNGHPLQGTSRGREPSISDAESIVSFTAMLRSSRR